MKKLNTLLILLFILPSLAFSQISEDDIFEIVDSIYAGVQKQDKDLINDFFEKDSFTDFVVQLQNDDSKIAAFRERFKLGFSESFDLGSTIINGVGTSYYDFINYYVSVNDEAHAIFRLFGEGGINYHDFILSPINDTLKITDVHFFASGERISQTFKTSYINALREHLNEGIFSKESGIQIGFTQLPAIKELFNNGKHELAYEKFMKLPEKARELKTFRLWKIHITAKLDNAKHIEAVAEYEAVFPDDPSLYILTLDKFFLDGNYNEAMNCVNKLDIAVGLDSFLDYYRGNIFFAKKDFEKAQAKFENVTKEYSGFMLAWTSLIVTYHETKQYSKLIDGLKRLENEMEKNDIIEYMKTEYPEFCKTKEFIDWKNATSK